VLHCHGGDTSTLKGLAGKLVGNGQAITGEEILGEQHFWPIKSRI
jgi:hypothetical protein